MRACWPRWTRRQIVFVDVAEDPDAGEVGDGERRGRAGQSHARRRGIGDILADDDAGYGSQHVHHRARVVFIHAVDLQLFFGSGQVGFGVPFRVFRLLQHGLRNCAVIIEVLGAQVRLVVHLLVVFGLEIGVERIADVGALHAEEELTLSHVVVEPDLEVDDAAVGKRDDGDFAGDIGKDGAGDVQLVGLIHALGGDGGVLLRIGDIDNGCVADLGHLGRRSGAGVGVEFAVAPGEGAAGEEREYEKERRLGHWITSRPTARLSCPAVVRYVPMSSR